MDRGAWWVYRVHRVAKSRPQLNDSLKHTLYKYKLDGQNQALHQVTVDPRVAGHQSQLLWAGRTLWRCRAWGMAGSSTPCWVRRIHGTYQSSACLRLSSRWAHPCTRKRYPCSAAYEGLVHTPATSCCPPHTPAFLCASLCLPSLQSHKIAKPCRPAQLFTIMVRLYFYSVGCDRLIKDYEISWRSEWQPTPVFLPGEFHEQRSLAGYSLWGHEESDIAEQISACLSPLACKLKNKGEKCSH